MSADGSRPSSRIEEGEFENESQWILQLITQQNQNQHPQQQSMEQDFLFFDDEQQQQQHEQEESIGNQSRFVII